MIYKNHEIIIKQYYTLDFKKSSVKEDIESVKNILEDSISHHMISDVEIGSFLTRKRVPTANPKGMALEEYAYFYGPSETAYA